MRSSSCYSGDVRLLSIGLVKCLMGESDSNLRQPTLQSRSRLHSRRPGKSRKSLFDLFARSNQRPTSPDGLSIECSDFGIESQKGARTNSGGGNDSANCRVAMGPFKFQDFSHVRRSTGKRSTRWICSSLAAYSEIGSGTNRLPLLTLTPISQIDIELTAIRSASAIACAAAEESRARFGVQETRAAVSNTITTGRPIRQGSVH